MRRRVGIKPTPHSQKATALTTAPSLLQSILEGLLKCFAVFEENCIYDDRDRQGLGDLDIVKDCVDRKRVIVWSIDIKDGKF